MKRFIGVIFLLFAVIKFSKAQRSIGFSNPEDIQPLFDYRLPDWGYSNFLLDFNFNGTGFRQKAFSAPSSSRSTSLGLNPKYILFRESEKRIFQLRSSVNLRYNGDYQKQETIISDEEVEDKMGNLQTVFRIDPSIREYKNENIFLFGNAPVTVNYRRFKDENKTEGEVTDKTISLDRFITAVPRIGIGFGRVRNVTPIIRAVRLNERINVINSGMSLGDEDIQTAADQFTRLEGYQRNYDRPSKYFWDDMNESISTDLSSLDAFDMLYLTDVLNEAIGSRFEGWEIITGIAFDYTNSLSREEEQSGQVGPVITRETFTQEFLGGFIDARWFKNTSLREQWGLFANVDLKYSLGDESGTFTADLKRNLNLVGGVNWLYNISDRVLVEAALVNNYFRTKQELNGAVAPNSEADNWLNNLVLSSELNYFIENRIQLNLTISPSLNYFGSSESENKLDSRTFNWQVGAGLRYYLHRNLY